jgi:cation transport ATPase
MLASGALAAVLFAAAARSNSGIARAGYGLLGAEGALIAALLHNLSTLLVLGNAGRLLRFQELLPRL